MGGGPRGEVRLVRRESYLSTKQIKKLAHPFLWNSKPEALKRESLLNTFADGSVNIVYIRTKI